MATYRFTLKTPDTVFVFGSEVVRNWRDFKPNLVKNELFRGIFREFTNTLEFTGNIREQVIRAFDAHGYDLELLLTIEVGNNNKNMSSFRVLCDNMKAEIADIDIAETYVSLNFIDTGFQADLMNRHDIKVNLNTFESIDGKEIQPFEEELKRVWLHDRTLELKSKYDVELDTGVFSNPGLLLNFIDYTIPLNITFRSHPELKNIPASRTFPVQDTVFPFSFFLQAQKPQQLNLNLSFELDYQCNMGRYAWTVDILRLRHNGTVNKNITVQTIRLAKSTTSIPGESGVPIFADMDTTNRTMSVNYSGVVNIEQGESLYLRFFGEDRTSSFANNFTMTTRNLTFDIESLDFDFNPVTNEPRRGSYADAVLPHELFTRVLQIATGEQAPFYSEYFGRTELGYEVNGEGAWQAVMNGKMMRGFPYADNPLNLSLKEAFEAFSYERNLVAFIETKGGKPVFRIETSDYMRNYATTVELTKMADLTRSIYNEKVYSNILCGYNDYEYEEVNGLYSFHGTLGHATPLRATAEELNIVSKWRRDDIGIELTRRKQYGDNPTLDYRSDKDIFIIDCRPQAGEVLFAHRPLSDYENITGTYENNRLYNINYSPARNLRYWGDEIRACLLYKENQRIKHVQSAKNPNVTSKKTGESEIIESADITISELKTPDFYPEKIMIAEAVLSKDEFESIRANPYGLIRFTNKGVDIFARIISVEFDINAKVANFELLRINY